MKVKFTGAPKGGGSETSVTMFGVAFKLGEAVDVGHLPAPQQAKLRGNGHFTVLSGETKTLTLPAKK